MSDAGRDWPEAVSSGGHLKCLSVPQIDSVGSALAQSADWHSVAAGTENDIDLVEGGEEPLRLVRGFEPPHSLPDSGLSTNHERGLFAFPGWAMCAFNTIV